MNVNLSDIVGRSVASLEKSSRTNIQAHIRAAVGEAFQAGMDAGRSDGVRSTLAMHKDELVKVTKTKPDSVEAKFSTKILNNVTNRMRSRYGINT